MSMYPPPPPPPRSGAFGETGAPTPPGYTPYGAVGGGGHQGPKPENYLVWGILTTLFCCLPFGVASIVYASKVDALWSAGAYAEAREASSKARTFAVTAAAVGGVLMVLWLAMSLLASAAGA